MLVGLIEEDKLQNEENVGEQYKFERLYVIVYKQLYVYFHNEQLLLITCL